MDARRIVTVIQGDLPQLVLPGRFESVFWLKPSRFEPLGRCTFGWVGLNLRLNLRIRPEQLHKAPRSSHLWSGCSAVLIVSKSALKICHRTMEWMEGTEQLVEAETNVILPAEARKKTGPCTSGRVGLNLRLNLRIQPEQLH
jgi:hypothetical protein